LPLEVRRGRSRSRAAVALAALVGPALPACRRHGSSTELAGSGGDLSLGADAPAAIEASGVWGGLRVRTLGERTRPRQVVVLFHGWGAPGTDLVPLGQVLAQPGRLFVFPEGPLVSPGGGRAWWHIDMARIQADRAAGRVRDLSVEVPQGLAAARERLLMFLDELPGRLAIEYPKTVIGGFSQGAMLSCDALLHTDYPVAGLVQLSSNLLARPIWQPLMAKRKGLRVFQSHGTRDDILPYIGAERLRDELTASGLAVDWHRFSGGHEIPESVMQALGRFLRNALAR